MEERKIKRYIVRATESHDKVSEHYLCINSCGLHKNSYFQTIRKNGRSDYQLLYVEEGVLILLDGEREITLTPGGFVLYSPNVPHNYYQKEGVCYWVHFTGGSVEEILRDASLQGLHYYQGKRHEPSITRCFEKMIFHYVQRSPLRTATLNADLVALLAELGGTVQGGSDEKVTDDRLRPIVLHMHRNYAATIDLDHYAEMIGLSRGRFLHLFREVIGVSPYAYVLELRLSRSAELLLDSDEPISSIAFSVGFSDPLYFSRLFKKRFSVSPDHFRRQAASCRRAVQASLRFAALSLRD